MVFIKKIFLEVIRYFSYLFSDPSPVMDMLNHNSRPSSASPAQLSTGESKSPNNLEGRPSQRYDKTKIMNFTIHSAQKSPNRLDLYHEEILIFSCLPY